MAKGDMFLKIEGQRSGPIKGESATVEHLDEIDVREWSWGMQGASGMGGSGASARTALSELRISKSVDSASTGLMIAMRNNELIKRAVLSVRKVSGEKPIDYLVITVENGRISSFDIGTEAPDSPVVVETFAIAFEKIEVAYSAQTATGARRGNSLFIADVSP